MDKTVSEMTKLWERVLSNLKDQINDRHIYETFFAPSYLHSVVGDTWLVVCDSSLAVTFLSTKYVELVNSTVREITESDFKVKFLIASEVKVTPKEEKPAFFPNATINPCFTFDNFVVGPCNKEANQAALLVAANLGKMYNPLFLFSESGLGKTHLLQAIGNYVKENNPRAKVLYISSEDFIDEFVKCIKGDKDVENIKDFFKSIDVLLMDDIQFLANKQQTGELFYQIFNVMVNNRKQIVLTSDRHPNDLRGIENRLVTRFNSGLSVSISTPDEDTCVSILKKKIEASGLDIKTFDDDVLRFISKKFGKNIRELEGALNKLVFTSINIKKTNKIDMDLARESMRNLVSTAEPGDRITENTILGVVCDNWNISRSQLTGKNRTKAVAFARHVAMYLLRDMLDMPLTKIGEVMGGKDHTTVMNGVQNVEKLLKNDDATIATIKTLKKRINQ